MFAPGQDDVSNIHRRWSFTTLGPSSSKVSYAIWLGCAVVIILASHLYHLQSSAEGLALLLPIGIVALVGSHFLDYLALHGTPVNKLSKVAHVSAFANGLWALTVLLGIVADLVFGKPPSAGYIIAGMLLAIGLRIGIFTSVFGAHLGRAIAVSFIQPLIFFIAFVGPLNLSIMISSSIGLAFGGAFVLLGVIWTCLADRAGRPGIKSTFGVLQAFIAAWTENRVDKMEEFTEAKAHDDIISTKIIRFGSLGAIVLPDVHPGPFSMVGGSNLPYVLYEAFNKRALVMHSVSDHSLNIPSRREVERYVNELSKKTIVETGDTCSEPIQIRINNATSTGIAFGRAAMVMLSLSPKGMEDIPQSVRMDLESFGIGVGYSDVLVIDSHNAMGKHLDESDKDDLISSAKKCLEKMKQLQQHSFDIGFAGQDDIKMMLNLSGEIGQAGIAVLAISVDGKRYAIGWADSNNMENRLRDYVLSKTNNDIHLLEICSSDTHSTSGKRTREGYFPLGTRSSADQISATYKDLCAKAAERATRSTFELESAQSTIKVMGQKQFGDYSSALDRSMTITKIFVAITVASYVAMLVLS